MPDSHLFLCNGATLARAATAWKTVTAEELRTGPNGNVRIAIPELAQRMYTNVAPVLADLTELAAFVYAADQAISRTGIKTFDYGDKWLRHFRFEVAVRVPDFWNQQHVLDCLCETLAFLTSDSFEFRFSLNRSPTSFTNFLGFGDANPEGIEKLTLFSGGIDSLAGAAEEILHKKSKVALVSHKPVSHLGARQTRLVEKITERLGDPAKSPFHLTVLANKIGALEHDHTQRSRSFLFTSIGAVVARLLGLNAIGFYENGIVSVNLPLCDQETNGRASRTTHPQSLHQFSQLLTAICGTPFAVANHFLSLTKQDVVQRLKDIGHPDLLRDSISCTHTRRYTSAQPHCGVCSQCLSRKYATLGANVECHDPDADYRNNVLVGARSRTEDRTLAERFVGTARRIEKMTTVLDFQQEFASDLARVSPYLPGSNRDAVAFLFDLHHRHATQVGQVNEQMMKRYVHDYRTGGMADTCTLWFAFLLGQSQTSQAGTGGTPGQDGAPISNEEIVAQVQRLKAMERDILQSLLEHNIQDPDFDELPSQKTLAGWSGYPYDATFKAALSALGKAGLVDNGRHHGRRGGYFLVVRGVLAAQTIVKMNGHD